MSAKPKGPRLWLRKARRNGKNSRDGQKKSVRDPDEIPVADVLALYAADVAPNHARPKETLQRVERLLAFFGGDTLSAINGDRCRAFARSRSTPIAAREDLSVLRAAINHHRQEGYCDRIVSVVLPEKPIGRDRWCTRSEAAKLPMVGMALSGGAEGEAHGSPHPAACRTVHVGRALYRDAGRCRLQGRPGADAGKGVDRSREGHLLSPSGGRTGDKKAQASRAIAPAAVSASPALETAWATLRGRMEWQARPRCRQGVSERRQSRWAPGRHSSHSSSHGRNLADAARHRSLAGR